MQQNDAVLLFPDSEVARSSIIKNMVVQPLWEDLILNARMTDSNVVNSESAVALNRLSLRYFELALEFGGEAGNASGYQVAIA